MSADSDKPVTKRETSVDGLHDGRFLRRVRCRRQANRIRLPEAMPVDRAAVIFAAGITAFHAADSSELKEGDWLAVIGAGEKAFDRSIRSIR